jgi:hypothetical protein
MLEMVALNEGKNRNTRLQEDLVNDLTRKIDNVIVTEGWKLVPENALSFEAAATVCMLAQYHSFMASINASAKMENTKLDLSVSLILTQVVEDINKFANKRATEIAKNIKRIEEGESE